MATTLKDLLAARTSAIAEDKAASIAYISLEAAAIQAARVRDASRERKEAAASRITQADRAIHDLLFERGMHSLVDSKDGTVVIYAAADQPPGWFATHPIPGIGA